MQEDEIAALDGDWAEFMPAQRAAFNLARKLSYEPSSITEADFAHLRHHFSDLQILEMILSIAGNNALNRWKEGIGVPQSHDLTSFARRSDKPVTATGPLPTKSFLTPTAAKYEQRISKVAPLLGDGDALRSAPAVCRRPPLESAAEVVQALVRCRQRKPRLPLVEEAKARQLLPMAWPAGPLPQWVRLLANFPKDGVARIVSLRATEEKGDLTPLLKAQVSWIIARQDQTWYALGEAKQRLERLGWSQEQIERLDGDWTEFRPAERALFTVSRKLAASPIVLTDNEVTEAVKQVGPKAVVQLINYTTNRASFNRITEAAGLQLEK